MEIINVDVISEGIAYGKVIEFKDNLFISKELTNNKPLEVEMFKKAIKGASKDLESLNIVGEDADFIKVHIMILNDPTLSKEVIELINTNSYKASYAFDIVINSYIKKFSNLDSTYLAERNLDFKDIRRRVLKKLDESYMVTLENDKVIIVCDELYPSYLMEYKDNIAGVIAKKGGETSHAAILCKAREIPYVITKEFNVIDNAYSVIDTREKVIYNDCNLELINKYKELKEELSKKKRIKDFQEYGIRILANVNTNDELYKVRKYNMYGVGLYRTEFIFMNKNRPLTEEEQYMVYSEATEILKQRPITFRTFDIGDDKQLPYIQTHKKGILNYKNNPELFESQIKALIRANKYSNMSIMFPMIESVEEFTYLRDWVFEIKNKMHNDSYLKVGMMLETKEAINHLEDFKDVDFFSLGTNDLTKELYDIDRLEQSNYKTYIDPLILELKKVVEHTKKYNIGLSICGEIAGISEVVSKLYDIGVKKYSVAVSLAKTLEHAINKKVGNN